MRAWTKFRYATGSHPGWKDDRTVTVTEWRLFGVLVWHNSRLHGDPRKKVALRGSARLPRWRRPLWQRDALENEARAVEAR
jgi:hypothetical protein